ncbi:MAG: hypothetical protein GYA73_05465 [Planctomycetes bacterium]|nr:hypothetical protein [Planctomycetota bacterium]
MPDAGIFGERWTPPDPKPNPFEVQFTSYRVPIWGDFYAKDGGAACRTLRVSALRSAWPE